VLEEEGEEGERTDFGMSLLPLISPDAETKEGREVLNCLIKNTGKDDLPPPTKTHW